MTKAIYSTKYDIIVFGGGVSGTAAAVSAARCGAKVLVVERDGYLGGTLTGSGVGPMMTFHAGDKQVIKGFMQEVVDRLVAEGYSPGHVLDTKQYVRTVTPFDAEGLKWVLDNLVTEENVQVLFHTFAGGVEVENNQIKSVSVTNKDGINKVTAKIYIDATGDGDIAAWSGTKMTKGREEDGLAQPMTLKMKYFGVDTKAIKDHLFANLEKFPALKANVDYFKQDIPMDFEGFEQEFAAAKKRGELSIARENLLMFGTGRAGEYIINTTRIIGEDATDAQAVSRAEIIGRRQCKELDSFLRKYVPGFKTATLGFTGPSIGIRGSRQLVGKYTLTAEDILQKRKFSDTIAHCGYPIDIHSPDGEGTESFFLKMGEYYNIPFSIMLPTNIENLIVTGRCVSATFEAQASIRLTPPAGSMGQAAGVAAALIKDSGTESLDIDLLRDTLIKQGAYIEK